MSTVLDTIIEHKKEELKKRKKKISIEELQAQILKIDRPRNFYAAVTKQPLRKVNLIAEIKKSSPSAGVIRKEFDPAELAKIYTEAGADAISVLTDEKFFEGKLEYINEVKKVTPLPILRKDFIIDEYQIYEARAFGADAILLIAEVLSPGQILDMLILSSTLKMTAIIEVHDADTLLEVRKTIGFPHERYSLLGINNRNLHTQTVDINNTLRLASMLDDSDKEVLISESGIKSKDDIDKLVSAGVRAVLIGETLLKSEDIPAKIEELLGPKPTD